MRKTHSPCRLIRANELAKRLSCGTSTVYQLARTKKIPAVIIGLTGVRFDYEAVMKALTK